MFEIHRIFTYSLDTIGPNHNRPLYLFLASFACSFYFHFPCFIFTFPNHTGIVIATTIPDNMYALLQTRSL
jgi:hypothetical protein